MSYSPVFAMLQRGAANRFHQQLRQKEQEEAARRRGDPGPARCDHVNYSLNGYGYRCDDCGVLFGMEGPK